MGVQQPVATSALTLETKYLAEEGRVLLTGTQALLRIMLERKRLDRSRGVNTAGLVCGYPGSPLGGLDFEIVRHGRIFKGHDIEHIQGLNEELAATAVFGTQLIHDVPDPKFDGVCGMWFGKAPGVDRAADAFHHANFHGISRNGGVLVVAGDDPHARSTILPADSNVILSSFYMPVLYPGNIQETLDFGVHGYELSRAAGLWVSLKMVADVAESLGSAEVGSHRYSPVWPDVEYNGAPLKPAFNGNVAGPGMIAVEREIFYGRLEIARQYARLNGLNRLVTQPGEARVGIVAAGKNYYDLREALEAMGLDQARLETLGIRILKLGMVYPFDTETAREFAAGLEEIIVIEDKRPFLEAALKEALYGLESTPKIIGKTDDTGALFLTACGEITSDILLTALQQRLGLHFPELRVNSEAPAGSSPEAGPLSISRMPYFCSGCPHNRSLRVPEGSVVGAGIGCHIMTLWMAPTFGASIGYTQMGGEGAQWVGLSRFSGTKHYFQNLGDGTFAHSGSLAIRFAIAAKANITYKLLVNSAVAMTGGQDVMGGKSVRDLVAELAAEGVRRIIVTTDEPERYRNIRLNAIASVRHRDDLVTAETELAATEGVTVLLNDQQCAAEKRRLRKRDKLAFKPAVPVIHERVCEGCGDCGAKSNCLSVEPVETEFGRKTRINQTSCNQDFSCLLGDCPSFLTVQAPPASAPKPRRALPVPPEALPEPVGIVPHQRFSIFMTGIGGTGVVTVNQILATAAAISGRSVRGMDQTGSSQKAGPLVSHLHIEEEARDGANRVLPGTTDLFLAFDLLGAAEPHHLRMATAERTVLIASTSISPTGEMVSNKDRKYPETALLRRRLEQITRAADSLYLDARAMANGLFGSETGANLLMVGAAYQKGVLPIPAAAIEEAIRLNGVAVEMNIAAFRWGRAFVSHPESLAQALPQPQVSRNVAEPLGAEASQIVAAAAGAAPALQAVLARRVPELIAFQNASLAQDYGAFVRQIREAEQRLRPGSTELAAAVAAGLYKLMAYKDEYEVARLLTLPQSQADLEAEFGSGVKVSYNLHPTFLRRLGVTKKVRFGPWFTPVLRLIAALKPLRGTALDPFGRSRYRRVERALIGQYRDLIGQAAASLNDARFDATLALARLPDSIRGYEDVKLASVTAFRVEAQRLATDLGLRHDFGPITRELEQDHARRAA